MKYCIAGLWVISLVLVFCIEGFLGSQNSDDEAEATVGQPLAAPVCLEATGEVRAPQYIYLEVEKPIISPLRQFQSEVELGNWLRCESTGACLNQLKCNAPNTPVDCDDYALALVRVARNDGYDVGIQVLYHPYTRGKLVVQENQAHMLNSTIIGNYGYYIEPQTGEFWRAWIVD